jgi:Ca2+/Na+ antiporter
MQVVLWLGLVVLGVATMQWGATKAADLLEALKGKYALTPTAGGALLGLATAAPETAVNTASVAFGWTDWGSEPRSAPTCRRCRSPSA